MGKILELLDGYLTVEVLESEGDHMTVKVKEDDILDVDANLKKMFPPGRVLTLPIWILSDGDRAVPQTTHGKHRPEKIAAHHTDGHKKVILRSPRRRAPGLRQATEKQEVRR